MTTLAVLNPSQLQAGPVAAAQATSLATTQRLASSGSVYAVAAAPGPAPPQQHIIPGSPNDPAIIALAKSAHDACFVQNDAMSCMNLNYRLASQMAAATCPNGAVTQDLIRKAQRGSIEDWLAPPVPYATVKVATNDVASVAVALGTLPK